jgi:hypothetical protein
MSLLTAALATLIAHVGFIRRDDLRALTLSVALALVSSPLIWSHYFALLIVPLALSRPRIDWMWTVPLLLWAAPLGWTVQGWQAILGWVSIGTMFVVLTRQPGPRPVADRSASLASVATAAAEIGERA